MPEDRGLKKKEDNADLFVSETIIANHFYDMIKLVLNLGSVVRKFS